MMSNQSRPFVRLRAYVKYVDYEILAEYIRNGDTRKKDGSSSVRVLLSQLFDSPLSGVADFLSQRKFMHKQLIKMIESLADDAGVTAKIVSEDYSDTLNAGDKSMFVITATIDEIDFKVLGSRLAQYVTVPNAEQSLTSRLRQALEIITPFINQTMATVPNDAAAGLLNLFARDKVIELAGEYGIAVSELEVRGG